MHPAEDFVDEESRRLRFPTNDPALDVIRVRPLDVATFVACGGAQLGICGADVLMEFDYPEVYAPLDLGIGRCRIPVAEPAETLGTDDPSRWSRISVAMPTPVVARSTSARAGKPRRHVRRIQIIAARSGRTPWQSRLRCRPAG